MYVKKIFKKVVSFKWNLWHSTFFFKQKSKSTLLNLTKDSSRKLASAKNFNVESYQEEMNKLAYATEVSYSVISFH